MDEEVWSSLEQLQLPVNDVAGLHPAAVDDALHAPFCWPALTPSFLAGDDIDITGSAADNNNKVSADDMALDLQGTSCFAAGDQQQQHDLLMTTTHHQRELTYSSSSLSSPKRSVSMDSAGTTSSPAFSFGLDDGAAAAAATFSSAVAVPHDPFAADDDAAIMRAMMAVLSSASPSSSESSSPPRRHHHESGSSIMQQAAAVVYQTQTGGNVVVRSTSLAVAPEKTTTSLLTSTVGGGRQQQQDDAARAAAAAGNTSQSQVYHMMSERKRREKLNDSFQTLRSLLPPCSKKDKTTVLINAASYLKKLEAEVSELEEKNSKLERHVPREDGGAATTTAAAHAQAAAAHRRAKVQVSRASLDAADQVNLTVMVMVECDIVDLVLHVLERLKWMEGVTVLSVDADTYSPQVLLKAIASIKLQITDGDCWNEASFREVMKKVVHDATSSPSCAAPLVAAA